jgi:hypothetical protein
LFIPPCSWLYKRLKHVGGYAVLCICWYWYCIKTLYYLQQQGAVCVSTYIRMSHWA